MRRGCPVRTATILAILCLPRVSPALGQEANDRGWTDRDGHHRTREELDRILAENRRWAESDATEGMRGGGLEGVHLSGEHTDLRRADLGEVDLTGANLTGADLSGASLWLANLSGANLKDANLTKAGLGCSNLRRTDFAGAELKGADFGSCGGLVGATDLKDALYEPKSNPEAGDIATAKNLEFLTYRENPSALVQLRKQFQDAGFRTQERKITYALNRRQAELDGPLERCFKTAAFDWTCQYGMNPGRALQIWLGLLVVCWVVYAVFIHTTGKSGIYLRKLDSPGKVELAEEQIRWRWDSATPKWQDPLRLVRLEVSVIFWAGFFSVMSAFNIGFREINFGRWLRLLPRTEYDLKAKGWARTVAGFQSLISVYLIALWVLTYFGRPFE